MPKRILDGEGLWRSDKLARVQPPEFRAEYANILPLAQANGSFEVNPRRVWSAVYSYNRSGVTPEIVEAILAEFERVRLLFRWSMPDGKQWGFWIGIDKPGRLPPPSRKNGRHELMGVEPPKDLLRQFLAMEPVGVERTDSHELATGQPMDSHEIANGCMGLGLGLDLGKTLTSNPKDGFDQPVLGDQFRGSDGDLDVDQALLSVWDYYVTELRRRPKMYTFTRKRKSWGKERLLDLRKRSGGSLKDAVEMMKICIERIRDDEHANGGPGGRGKKFNGWEHVFDSTERMEKWMNQGEEAELNSPQPRGEERFRQCS